MLGKVCWALALSALLAGGCKEEEPRVPERYVNIDYTCPRPQNMTLGVLQDSSLRNTFTFLCIDHPPVSSIDEVVEFEQSNLNRPEVVAEFYFQGLMKEQEVRHFSRKGFEGKTLVKSSFTETLSQKRLERYQQMIDTTCVLQGGKLLYINPSYQLGW